MKRIVLAVLASVAFTALGLSAAPANALTGPPEPTSMAQGNLFSLDHMDFEDAADLGAVSSSNATITQGTGTTMLHNAALKDTVPATGNTVFKLANGNEISVVPGAQYRVGSYFHTPTVTGDTVTFAFGGYDSSGVWQGWTSGATDTLANTANWQYESDVITVPSTVTNVIGVRVTITGTVSGDIVRMDEAYLASQRAGIAIGAHGDHCGDGTCGSYSTTDWLDANQTSPPGIGPLQVNKEFFGSGDGLTWSATHCADIENSLPQAQWPVCIIAYKDTLTQAQMTAFLQAIPADQPVDVVPHQEPEGDYPTGADFVSYFEGQYTLYKAAGNFPNVMFIDDSASYPYKADTFGCSYTVPTAFTDGYAIDDYESKVDGKAMNVNVDRGGAFTTWDNCVKDNQRPIGIAEEGYDQGTSSNVANTPAALSADSTYLSGLPDVQGTPVLFRAYWDTNFGGAGGNWKLSNSTEVTEWQRELALNGGF